MPLPETERPAKIAVSGAMCSGKTTLLEDLSQYYAGNEAVTFVPEQARLLFQEQPGLERFHPATQMLIVERMQAAELAVERVGTVAVCDRSVIDAAIYVRMGRHAAAADFLLARVESYLPTYDKFLLTDPADIPFEQDEIRTETPEQRDQLHALYLRTFEAVGIDYELISGNQEERLAQVTEIVEPLRQPAAAEQSAAH